MLKFIMATMILLSSGAQAQYKLLDVDVVNMQFAQFACNRDPIIPELSCNDWRGRAEINADLRVLEYLYWKNSIHGEGTNSAFKTMGWHFELGINVSKYIDIFYEHHSRHVLDQGNATHFSHDGMSRMTRFPVEDSYGVRFKFYENTKKRSSLSDKLYP